MFKMRKFDLMVALYIFGVLCAELLGSKTFPILKVGNFQFVSGVAVFVMPLIFLLPDVVVEVYGRARARSMVYTGFVVICLLVAYSSLAIHLPPTKLFAARESAYDQIFGYSVRLAIASLSAFAISELLDILIFSKLRQALQRRALWLRSIVSNMVSHFSDSAIFLTLAFYSFDMSVKANAVFLLGLILPYWLLRSTLSVLETPLVYAGVWWLRRQPADDVRAETAP